MPTLAICYKLECGQTSFHNYRKDKHGLNLQAICDYTLRIVWAEIKWPAATSDYMDWVTTSLCMALEDNTNTKIILDGFTIIGDNAYVKKMFMATPLNGMRKGFEDGFIFYNSQLRITIE